jgi:hypothetical protein
MNLSDAQEAFRALPLTRKVVVLAWIMYELTVAARDTYEVGTDKVRDAARLRSFNELQHRLSAQAAKYAAAEPGGIPDEMIVAMIFEHGADCRRAFERVMEREIRPESALECV